MDYSDLPSALLTPRQREILLGEDNIGERANRAARARIRERLQASVFDLQLIVSALPLKEIDKALSEPDDYELEPGSRPPLANSMHALPVLLYLYHREQEITAQNAPDGWRTSLDIERGVENALTRMGVSYDEVSNELRVVRGPDLEELSQGDLMALSNDQLGQLHRAGLITSDQFVDAAWRIKQQGDETDEE